MFSLDKEHSVEDVLKWLRNKNVPSNTLLVITAKYDGISILKNELSQKCWSRGDGMIGETMHEHYKQLFDKAEEMNIFSIGEMLIPKPVFACRTYYRENGEAFKNARNMIAGMKNNDRVSSDLQYAKHVRYGFASEDFTKDKTEQLDLISDKLYPVPYKVISADKLTVEELDDLFVEWGKEFDIDGLVVDVNDKDIRKNLGRERNNNPSYSRAYKNPEWSEVNTPSYSGIEWNLSKTKAIKPVVLLEPFDVEGVTISRVTGYNAKFIKENSIGEGSVLEVIRSGGVIPKIVGVVKSGTLDLPTECPSCNSILEWNENGVDLVCNNEDCGEIKFQKLAFFFVRFKISGFAEKTIKKFYDVGYDTVGKILSMTSSDIQQLEGMGHLSANKLLVEFNEKVKNVSFNVIGHASGCFENIGSRKLKMIVDGIKETEDEMPIFNEFKSYIIDKNFDMISYMAQVSDNRSNLVLVLNDIKGMSNTTSYSFLNGLIKFNEFVTGLDINITDEAIKKVVENVEEVETDMKKQDLTGMSVLFTGVRRQDLADEIVSRGGKNLSGISKNVTHLICKDKNSSSSKMVKAKKLGIEIMDVEELETFLNE